MFRFPYTTIELNHGSVSTKHRVVRALLLVNGKTWEVMIQVGSELQYCYLELR
jgi:hypothetical protein